MKSTRVTYGALGGVVFCISVAVLIGAPTLVGRVLGSVLPSPFEEQRPRFMNLSALVDTQSTPPRYLGVANHPGSPFTTDEMSRERMAVTISGAGSVTAGIWAPTRITTDVRVMLTPVQPEAGISLDAVAQEGVRGLRAEFPSSTALVHPGLSSLRIDPASGVSDTIRISAIDWTGYAHNTVSAISFGAVLWAIWPRRKPASTLPS